LVIGYADLGASLGRGVGFPALGWTVAQELLIIAARSAGLVAVDGPYLGIAADDEFRDDVARSVQQGFDAKWVIHPRQVTEVNDAFTPSEKEVAHAKAVLEALAAGHEKGVGAVQLDGALVDEAMAVAARRVLAKVGA